jgi:hypothetical protein
VTSPRVVPRSFGDIHALFKQELIVRIPEEYRAMAKECLRDAETVPEGLRLSHIVIAQLWLELAEKVIQLRLEVAAVVGRVDAVQKVLGGSQSVVMPNYRDDRSSFVDDFDLAVWNSAASH